MKSKKRGQGSLNLPTDYEYPSLAEHFRALQRILQVAKNAGASPADVNAAGTWPLMWKLEEMRRHEFEGLAEIGRKVSNSRDNENHDDRDRRDIEIIWLARELLLAGAKPRGLAAKIKKNLKSELSVRQINRILNIGMRMFFAK